MSFTGNEVTGVSSTTAGWYHAFRWTRRGMQDLGTLPGHDVSYGYGISGDGEVVTGLCDNAAGALTACLWTDRLGMVDLQEHLAALGVDLTGWTLTWATGLSADGSSVVGWGSHNGELRGWLVRVRSIEGTRGDPRGRPACPHVHGHRSPVERLLRRPHR